MQYVYFFPFGPAFVAPYHAHYWVVKFQTHNRCHRETRICPSIVLDKLHYTPCLQILPVVSYLVRDFNPSILLPWHVGVFWLKWFRLLYLSGSSGMVRLLVFLLRKQSSIVSIFCDFLWFSLCDPSLSRILNHSYYVAIRTWKFSIMIYNNIFLFTVLKNHSYYITIRTWNNYLFLVFKNTITHFWK